MFCKRAVTRGVGGWYVWVAEGASSLINALLRELSHLVNPVRDTSDRSCILVVKVISYRFHGPLSKLLGSCLFYLRAYQRST